jgi:hypothetical protein
MPGVGQRLSNVREAFNRKMAATRPSSRSQRSRGLAVCTA